MKKGIRIFFYSLGGLVLLLVLLAVVLPIVFKPQILRFAQEEINRRVDAQVEFEDLTVSLFRGFPHLYVSLDGLSVVNRAPFAGDTLVSFDRLAVRVNLMSLFDLSSIQVHSVLLDHPVARARRDAAGRVNWSIMKPGEPEDEESVQPEGEASAGGAWGVALSKLEIRRGDLRYWDDSASMEAVAQGLNFTLRGDLGLQHSQLDLSLLIERVHFAMGGVVYAPALEVGFDAGVDADLEGKRYRLIDNTLRLNGLSLGFEGEVAMPGDSIVTDLRFATQQTSFKTLLSLVPAVYSKDFDQLQVKGDLQLNGEVRGVVKGDELPNVNLKLLVAGGGLRYPNLPKSVEAVEIDLGVAFDGKTPDATVVDLSRLSASVGGNPIALRAHVRTPISDPNVRAEVTASVDFATLHDVLPLEGKELSGRLDADISLAALLSQVKASKYEECTLDGHLRLARMMLRGVLSVPVAVEEMEVAFSPKLLVLKSLKASAGKSDAALTGQLVNFLPFIMSDGVLGGSLSLRSGLVDLNELFPSSGEEADGGAVALADPQAVSADTAADLSLLRRVNFAFASQIDQVNFQKMEMRSVVGNFSLADSELLLQDISCQMLGGSVKLGGRFDFRREDVSRADISARLSNVDVKQSVATFTMLEQILPTVKYIAGSVGLQLDAEVGLTPSFSPLLPSLQAVGSVSTSSLTIAGSPLFVELGRLFKDDNLSSPTLSPMRISFKIKDGSLILEPFSATIAGVQSEVSGTVGLDQNVDVYFGLKVPRAKLGAAAGAVDNVLSKLSSDVRLGETVPVTVHATGPATSPKLSLRVADDLQKQVKQAVVQKVEEVKEKVIERAVEEAEKALAEAQRQADNLLSVASQAAGKLRSEASAQADRLVSEAKKKGPLAALAATKAAEKIVQEADKKATQLEQEARSQADALLAKAREEIDKHKN